MIIKAIHDNDKKIVDKIIVLEDQAFGNGGMNEWHLVPFIRHGQVFAAVEGEEVLGAVQYMRDWQQPERAYLYGVSVSRERRGKGLGTVLLRDSFRELLQSGITEVELTVDPQNAAAIRVYQEKLGFSIGELRRNEYGAGEDRLVMRLQLASSKWQAIKEKTEKTT